MLQGALTFVAALGSVATAISLYFLMRQTAVANHLARTAAHDRLTDLALGVDSMFIENPDLRPYFYNSAPYIQLPARDQSRLFAIAEYLADFFENALIHEKVLGHQVYGEWAEYARQTMRDSPVLRAYLHNKRAWYDDLLTDRLDEVEASRHRRRLPPESPPDVRIVRNAELSTEQWLQARHLYEAAFPPYEQVDFELLKYGEHRANVFALSSKDDVVGFAFVLDLQAESTWLLEYIAVVETRRSSGIGSAMLAEVDALVTDAGGARYLVEVEAPGEPTSSPDARRRIDFYALNNCSDATWISSYFMPNLDNPDETVPMRLLSRQLRPEPFDSHIAVEALYRAAYGAAGESYVPRIKELVQAPS
jgi:hypothetical protein